MPKQRAGRLPIILTIVGLLVPMAVPALAAPVGLARGDLYRVAGTGDPVDSGPNGDGGPAIDALVSSGRTATDAAGNLLIFDAAGNRLRIVTKSASNPGYALAGCASACTWRVGKIYTIAGNGTYGYNGDGIPATSAWMRVAQLNNGFTLDNQGNPIIVDTANHRVRIVAVAATNPGYALTGCASACLWTVGNIYTIAGNGEFGYNGDGIPAGDARLFYPSDATVDALGNVVIAAPNSERVRVVARSATNPGYLLAGCANACTWTVGDIYTVVGTGDFGYNGDGIPATSAKIASVTYLADDAQGNLLMSDVENSRVRVVAVSATNPGYPLAGCASACTWAVGNIFTVAGTGNPSGDGDGGPAPDAGISPSQLTIDHHGNVLVVSEFTRVRLVAVSASNPSYHLSGCFETCKWKAGSIYAIVGDGTRQYSGEGRLAIDTGLTPQTLSVAANGNLYVGADNRILEVIEVETAPSKPGAPTADPANEAAYVYWKAPDSDGGQPVTGYIVTPYIDGAVPQTPRLFASTYTSQIIRGLTNGTVYTFRVAAVNALGTGPQAGTALVRPGRPPAPRGIVAVSNPTVHSLGSITVSYVTTGLNGGAPITKFTAVCTPAVNRRDGVKARVAVHRGPKVVPIVVGGLVTGRNYSCIVRAANSRGDGPKSVASRLIPVGAPGAPKGTHPVRIAPGVFKVFFSPGPSNGARTRSFAANCTSADGGVTRRAGSPRSPITVTGLSVGKKYTCVVNGTNSRGPGPVSGLSPRIKA